MWMGKTGCISFILQMKKLSLWSQSWRWLNWAKTLFLLPQLPCVLPTTVFSQSCYLVTLSLVQAKITFGKK